MHPYSKRQLILWGFQLPYRPKIKSIICLVITLVIGNVTCNQIGYWFISKPIPNYIYTEPVHILTCSECKPLQQNHTGTAAFSLSSASFSHVHSWKISRQITNLFPGSTVTTKWLPAPSWLYPSALPLTGSTGHVLTFYVLFPYFLSFNPHTWMRAILYRAHAIIVPNVRMESCVSSAHLII